MKVFIGLVSAAIILTACGGGSGGSPVATPTAKHFAEEGGQTQVAQSSKTIIAEMKTATATATLRPADDVRREQAAKDGEYVQMKYTRVALANIHWESNVLVVTVKGENPTTVAVPGYSISLLCSGTTDVIYLNRPNGSDLPPKSQGEAKYSTSKVTLVPASCKGEYLKLYEPMGEVGSMEAYWVVPPR